MVTSCLSFILTRVSWELRAFYFGEGTEGDELAEIVQKSCRGRARSCKDTCSGAVSLDLGSQMAPEGVPSRRARPSAKAFQSPESRGQIGSFGTLVCACSGAVSFDLGSQMAPEGVPSRRARSSAKAFWAPELRGQLGSFSPESGKACEFSYARA